MFFTISARFLPQRSIELGQGIDRRHPHGRSLQQGSGDLVDEQGHRADAGGLDQAADALQVHRYVKYLWQKGFELINLISSLQ